MPFPAQSMNDPGAHAVAGSWLGPELREAQWRTPVPVGVIEELERVLTGVLPDPVARAADFPLTVDWLRAVRDALCAGHGVVVAGAFPMRRWGLERSRQAVRLVSRLLGPTVEQTHRGVEFYAVADRGLTPAPGVRRSLTNVEQSFHTDGPWVARTPRVVGLYCLRSASRGGVSRCLSLRALVADLARESPELAARLEEDFLWHRQGEHASGDEPVSRLPMVWHDASGSWAMRSYTDYVRSGYRAAGEVIDAEADAALTRIEALAGDPARWLEFKLAPGEVLWVNNRWCAHARTAFEAARQVPRPRLLMRVWHRLESGGTKLED